MDTTNLIPASVRAQVDGEIKALLSGAKIEAIHDDFQRENLGELVKAASRERIGLEAERVKAKAPYLEAGRAVDEYFNPPVKGLKDMAENYGKLCLAYDTAERKKIEDARIAAERAAAAERARLEAIEAKKREEAARLLREAEEAKAKAAAAEGAEQFRLEAEQAEKERKANLAFEAANKKEEQAAAVVAEPVFDTYRTPAGIKEKKIYRAEIVDRVKFITACIAQKKYHWLEIDEGKVNAEVKANEGQWQFDGARVVEETKARINTRMKV